MIFLTCVTSSEITDERPTSEPVPAVVGTATKYGSAAVDRPHLRVVPRVFEDVAGMIRHQRDRLRDVERRAAADADRRCRLDAPGYASAPAITWLRTGLPQMPENTACVTPAQLAEEALEDGQGRESAIGDDERTRARRRRRDGRRPPCARPRRTGSTSGRRTGACSSNDPHACGYRRCAAPQGVQCVLGRPCERDDLTLAVSPRLGRLCAAHMISK